MSRLSEYPHKYHHNQIKKLIADFLESAQRIFVFLNRMKEEDHHVEIENINLSKELLHFCSLPYKICKLFIVFFSHKAFEIIESSKNSSTDTTDTMSTTMTMTIDDMNEIINALKVFGQHGLLTSLFQCEHNRKILHEFFKNIDFREENKQFPHLYELDKSIFRTNDVHEDISIKYINENDNVQSIFHTKYNVIFDGDKENVKNKNIFDIEFFVEGLCNDIKKLYCNFVDTFDKIIFNEYGYLSGKILNPDGNVENIVIPIKIYEIKLNKESKTIMDLNLVYEKMYSFKILNNKSDEKDTKIVFTKTNDLKDKIFFLDQHPAYSCNEYGGMCTYYYDKMIKAHKDSIDILKNCKINNKFKITYDPEVIENKRVQSYNKHYTKEISKDIYQYMQNSNDDMLVKYGLSYEYEKKFYSKIERQLEDIASYDHSKFKNILEFLRQKYDDFNKNVNLKYD
jgi:hypothetical protein